MTESQVKALFLFNFAKYVSWPAGAFSETNAPLVIGVIGQSKLAADLKSAATGKSIIGHPVRVVEPKNGAEWAQCHVLFIDASEKEHLQEIILKVKNLPVLTVGESDLFQVAGYSGRVLVRKSAPVVEAAMRAR
ncbi:MAG: YfiR family protein [Akkermansiaceae bacterium]|nr:YfiR family protein [Verrucomicrobiales bacterium]